MGAYEHERDRLHRLVDQWIDSLNEDWPAEDARIDTAMIGGILLARDSDGDLCEIPSFFSESARRYQQIGVLTRLREAVDDVPQGDFEDD